MTCCSPDMEDNDAQDRQLPATERKIEKARGVPANELIKKLEPFIYKY